MNSDVGQVAKGLLIEIQYRTVVQHAWAKAVEVIGFITASQPKFQQGDKRYETAMLYASEIIARAHEGLTSFLAEEPDAEVLRRFAELDHELGLIALLRGLNAVDSVVSANRNVILIFGEMLEVRSFASATEALQALFELEKASPGKDIVLVRADTSDDMRNAFRNYFSDAREFIDLIEKGRGILAHPVASPAVVEAG